MPEEKFPNPFQYPTAEQVADTPGSRAQKAARNIAVRHMGGIPIRAFLMGGNDHSPMMQGIADLTEAVYMLLDEIGSEGFMAPDENGDTSASLDPDGFGRIANAAESVKAMLEHHGCPAASEA